MSRAGSKKTRFEVLPVFTARRYASAVYAVVACPSVRPSVTSRHCIETIGRIELVLAWAFLAPIPHCVIRKCGYLQKLVYFPNSGLKISPRQVDHVVNKIRRRRRRRSSLLITPIRQSTSRSCLLYKSIICNPLTHVLRFVADLLYNFCLQCFDAVGWAAGRASGL